MGVFTKLSKMINFKIEIYIKFIYFFFIYLFNNNLFIINLFNIILKNKYKIVKIIPVFIIISIYLLDN